MGGQEEEAKVAWSAAPDAGTPEASPPKAPPTQEELALAFVNAAIKQDLTEHPPDGFFDASARFFTVMQDLAVHPEWRSHQAHLILGMGTAMYQQQGDRIVKKKAEAERKGVLLKKGYELTKATANVDGRPVPIEKLTLPQRRMTDAERAKWIKQHEYPRWSKERMKRELERDSQERKLTRQVTRFMVGDKQMEFGFGMERLDASLETPRAEHYRAIASKGGKAKKSARTKNQ